MKKTTEVDPVSKIMNRKSPMALKWRDYDWFHTHSPWGARFIGAMIALALTLPFIPATFIERSLGETHAVVIPLIVAAVALLAGLVLLKNKFLILSVFAFALVVGSGLSAVISHLINW